MNGILYSLLFIFCLVSFINGDYLRETEDAIEDIMVS